MFDNVMKLDYVSVEIVKKNSINKFDLNSGLFSGYYKRVSDTRVTGPEKNTAFDRILFMLALTCEKDAIYYFNMMSHTVVSIEYVIDKIKHIHVFSKDKEDQLKALDMLEKITKALVDHKVGKEISGTIGKSMVIEPTKYENYPADLLDKAVVGNNGYSYKNTNNSQSSNTYKPAPPKEEVTVINRKGKLPSKKFLEEMRNKVELVAKGELKVKLPKTDGDSVAEEHY
jgi:hypothetical protein